MAERPVAPEYKRLGALPPERFESEDGVGTFAAELYECGECHSVVWWGSIPDHTLWHYPLATDSTEATP